MLPLTALPPACPFAASGQLKDIGVVDEVIWEPAQGETHEHFPIMAG